MSTRSFAMVCSVATLLTIFAGCLGAGPTSNPPKADPDSATVEAGQLVTINVLSNDDPGTFENATTTLKVVAILQQPRYGSAAITSNGASVVYTANPGTGGRDDTFLYQATQVSGSKAPPSVDATVTVAITPPPPAPPGPPTAVDDEFRKVIRTGGAILLDVLANDVPNDEPPRIVSATSPSGGGSVFPNPNGGNGIFYIPPRGATGVVTETFEYTVSNSGGLTDTAQVTVTSHPSASIEMVNNAETEAAFKVLASDRVYPPLQPNDRLGDTIIGTTDSTEVQVTVPGQPLPYTATRSFPPNSHTIITFEDEPTPTITFSSGGVVGLP